MISAPLSWALGSGRSKGSLGWSEWQARSVMRKRDGWSSRPAEFIAAVIASDDPTVDLEVDLRLALNRLAVNRLENPAPLERVQVDGVVGRTGGLDRGDT